MTEFSSVNNQQQHGIDLDRLLFRQRQQRALIIDDETESVNMMKMILMGAGIDVSGAYNPRDALEKLSVVKPDVILLDLLMPEVNGYELYNQLRKRTEVPIVIVSARAQTDDIVRGLQLGATDYVTKPQRAAELIARVRTAMVHTIAKPANSIIDFPAIELRINITAREVRIRDKIIFLPEKEFEVLTLLARQAPSAVRKETFTEEIWGENSDKAQKRVKYLIFLLRQKLEENPSEPKLIINHDRFGYRLNIEN